MTGLIVQVRINEGQTRDANPHVPYAPEEIAQTVVECWRAGASVVHWHAREPENGAVSTDAALYAEAARQVRPAGSTPDRRVPASRLAWRVDARSGVP